jgi:hypothetical protein
MLCVVLNKTRTALSQKDVISFYISYLNGKISKTDKQSKFYPICFPQETPFLYSGFNIFIGPINKHYYYYLLIILK